MKIMKIMEIREIMEIMEIREIRVGEVVSVERAPTPQQEGRFADFVIPVRRESTNCGVNGPLLWRPSALRVISINVAAHSVASETMIGAEPEKEGRPRMLERVADRNVGIECTPR